MTDLMSSVTGWLYKTEARMAYIMQNNAKKMKPKKKTGGSEREKGDTKDRVKTPKTLPLSEN